MIDLLPLAQMCSPGFDFANSLMQWHFVEAFTCQYASTTGFAVLGLVVWSAVSGAIVIRTGSFILPFGLLLMTGGAVLSQMASVALPVAVLLMLVLPSAATALLYIRYSR